MTDLNRIPRVKVEAKAYVRVVVKEGSLKSRKVKKGQMAVKWRRFAVTLWSFQTKTKRTRKGPKNTPFCFWDSKTLLANERVPFQKCVLVMNEKKILGAASRHFENPHCAVVGFSPVRIIASVVE